MKYRVKKNVCHGLVSVVLVSEFVPARYKWGAKELELK